ncbi:MAG: thioredoxin family protein [Mangrovibacterium sp.]
MSRLSFIFNSRFSRLAKLKQLWPGDRLFKTFVIAFSALSFQSCASDNVKTAGGEQGAMVIQASANEKVIQLIGKEQFLKEIWNYKTSPNEWKFLGTKPAIIDFYADWCGPCKIASPILEEVAQEYQGKIRVYKIDTEKERELASVFGVQSIPSFLYIPAEGKPVMMAGIGRSKEQTKSMFIENIKTYLLKD